MKNLALKTKYVVVAIIIAFNCSCSVEDGAQGPPGAAGTDGVDGTNGADGTNGNANVQTLKFDATGFSGPFTDLTIPQITQDVLDDDAILSYVTNSGTYWVSVPCPYSAVVGFPFAVHVTTSLGFLSLDYGDSSGAAFSISAGDLQELKVIIIESTTSTSGKTSNTKQKVYDKLKNAGVDIEDYYAVCDYYDLEY